jgi:dephospho-CoA kinase
MLIGIVGLNGSGKDAMGRYLASKYGFASVDIGQVIRDELKAMGKDYLNRNEMRDLGNSRRKEFGLGYWCSRAISSAKADDVVITSIRNQGEVAELFARGGTVVEVFADEKTRFDRTVARRTADPNAHGDVQSFAEFRKHEEIEFSNTDLSKMQMGLSIKAAQYRIDNNGTHEQLYQKIDVLLAELRAKAKPSKG